jgi:membrane-bound metal-dependent hydrolase YbcI (DUF457 family)
MNFQPMRPAESVLVGRVRPRVAGTVLVVWLLAAALWPLGTLARELVARRYPDAEHTGGFGLLVSLFLLTVAALGVGALAVLAFRGRWFARLGVTFLGVIGELVAVVYLVAGVENSHGPAAVVEWSVLIARVLFVPVAVALSFLPSMNSYCRAG